MKNRTKGLVKRLIVNKVLEKPWIYLTMNFIMKLLSVAEKNMILVVCNRLSKMIYFVVIIKGISVEELAKLFRDNI